MLSKTRLQNQSRKQQRKKNYEKAAFWRDKLIAIQHSTSSQNVIFENEENKDILGYYVDDENKFIRITIMHIREGHIINKNAFSIDLKEKLIHRNKIFSSIIEQYYLSISPHVPIIIVLPELYEGVEVFRQVLKKSNKEFTIRLAQEREYGLLRIAKKNAKVIVEQEIQMQKIRLEDTEILMDILKEMKDALNLPRLPRIIEGFDISNIEGTDATGSMVYFLEGKASKKNYRHYKIKTKSTPDDVGMMKEVLKRRYSMILEKNLDLPDLILVDGGKGQLNAALEVLNELEIPNVPIIGLAKKYEEIFIPKQKDPIIFPQDSQVLKIFQQIRDEAHRFAVRLHKKQRERKYKTSLLDDIKGVGPSTRNKLLTHFGSVKNLRKASLEELSLVVRADIALKIKNLLKD